MQADSSRPAPPATGPVLEAVDLECVRHDRRLFSGLNFNLYAGQVMQVEGPNGSGKTSLLRTLCGLLLPTQGTVRWCGEDIQTCRSDYHPALTYLGHLHGIKDELTPVENLRVFRGLGCARADIAPEQALHDVGLYGFENIPVRALSAGQRRRVALARLVLSDTTLWILDEPFTSLDGSGRDFVEKLLERHSGNGGLTVLTTHQEIRLPNCDTQRVNLAA